MGKFVLKIILLVSTLLFGLLLGLQQAERGISSLEGTAQEEQKGFYVKKIEDEHVEVAVLGEAFSTKQLEEKKEKWKERNQHNTLSHVGNVLGSIVYTVAHKGAQWVVQQMDRIL